MKYIHIYVLLSEGGARELTALQHMVKLQDPAALAIKPRRLNAKKEKEDDLLNQLDEAIDELEEEEDE